MNYLINLYKTNTMFHSFVAGLEGALVAALVSYDGSLPTNKAEWAIVGAFFGKAAWGWLRGWLTAAVVKPQ